MLREKVASQRRFTCTIKDVFMPALFKTHDVLNQPYALEDYNLFTGDAALVEAVEREGAPFARNSLEPTARSSARPKSSSSARSPIAIRRISTPTTATAAASTWCASIPPITS